MYMQVLNFHLKGMSEAEFRTLCDQLAPQLAAAPGLISKVWLANEATNTYGGVYTWESREAMERFTESELFRGIASHPNFEGIASTDFGVLEGPTRVSRGIPAAGNGRVGVKKFVDFHPNWPAMDRGETIDRLRAETKLGKVDQYGVRQVEFFYSPDGEGAYCVLEAPDKEAVNLHHGGKDVGSVEVESLL